MFTKIIGHDNVKTFLEKSIANERVAHAYLFVGPAHVGKMTIARLFSENLLHEGKIMTHSLEVHPDVVFISRLIDAKTGEPKSVISIEQIRELRERLSRTSLLVGRKIAIIDEADKMTIEAANALLKTLEEPLGRTVIILIAGDARFVPQTIKSRVQLVRFNIVPRKILEASLIDLGVERRKAEKIAGVARGRPGAAIKFVENQKFLDMLLNEVEDRRKILESPVYERINWVEDNAKFLKGSGAEEELMIWREIFRDQLLRELDARELCAFDAVEKSAEIKGDIGQVLKRIYRLMEAEEGLKHYVDPRLSLEHFLI